MEAEVFMAGAARCEITPPLGSLINGDFITHYARQIHDPLYAKALVLKRGGVTVCFLVVDICSMHNEFVSDVKAMIQARTAIPPDHILISCTHTHGAGSIESLLLTAADWPYRQRLPARLVQAVEDAVHRLSPAKIAFGSVDAPEHVVCRRYFMKPGYQAYNPVTDELDLVKTNPAGHGDQIDRRESTIDPELQYMAIKGTDDSWIGVLANYSMHYVGDWENGVITADYFGVFDRALAENLGAGADFVGMMSNGTSGDANIMDFMDPDRYPAGHFEKSTLIGRDLAGRVAHSTGQLEWDGDPSLAVEYEEMLIRLRKPTEAELVRAKDILSATHYETLRLKESHTGNEDGFRRIYAREQVLLSEFPDRVPIAVQLFRIGKAMIGALGGEIFSETGLWLKKHIRALSGNNHYFTVGLANGSMGYIPPAREFELGGYETWRSRSSCMEEHAESILREQLLELARLASAANG